MLLIGKSAPDFTASAVLNGERLVSDFSLSSFRGQRDVLLFFYPKDFSSVCPTELIGFQAYLKDFHRRGVEVVGVSTDSAETHLQWMQKSQEDGGIEGVRYPLVSDFSKVISLNYGVLGGAYDFDEEKGWRFEGLPMAYRGIFLIDKKGVVRHQAINDIHIVRNPLDSLHVIDRLRYLELHGRFLPCEVGEEPPRPLRA